MTKELQPKSDLIQARVLIMGKVQGVGYRFSTLSQAQKLKVNGWVRNLPDGRVEAIFEGKKVDVEQMIYWCHNGPVGAIVRNVEIQYCPIVGIKGFRIQY